MPHSYVTIFEAARLLHMTPKALRARCLRAVQSVNGSTFAHLGDGIVAVKLGRSWRIRFEEHGAARSGGGDGN